MIYVKIRNGAASYMNWNSIVILVFVRITDEAHEFRNKYWDVELIQEKLQNEYGDIIGGDQTRLMVTPTRFQHTKDVRSHINWW